MINMTPELEKGLNHANDCLMLGMLAVGEDAYPNNGEEQDAVTVIKNGDSLLFYIKPLCYDPEPIQELDDKFQMIGLSTLYMGIDYYMKSLLPAGYSVTLNLDRKKEMLKEKLQGKVILFRPKIRLKNIDLEKERIYKNVDVLAIEHDIKADRDMLYMTIPEMAMDTAAFEEILMEGKPIEFADYNHTMAPPEYVICGGYIYSSFTSWEKVPKKATMWKHTPPQKIKKLKLEEFNEELNRKMVRATDYLVFIDDTYLLDTIDLEIKEKGEPLEKLISVVKRVEEQESPKDKNYVPDDSELGFLKAFMYNALNEQLCYDERDLINFHTSVKTNPLTIISGMSGTGKTQLALSYAAALGLKQEEKNLLILPISPAYTEPGDILGYLNTTNGLYMPSDTGLTDFLIEAGRNEGKMFMVIFDEMNLAQVEHWFAPFISLLELKPADRALRLYSEKALCHNRERYPDRVHIKDNVVFIGTVNIDETTKDFSDRLLDRANIVTLKKRLFVDLKRELDDIEIYPDIKLKENFKLKENYRSWVRYNNPWKAFNDEEFKFFDSLHELINRYDPQKGVSFRVLERVGDYLNNIPQSSSGELMIDRGEAIDIQMKQRIMTKLRGPAEQYEELIGKLSGHGDTPSNSELFEFFSREEAKSISAFKLTLQEIKRKARELCIYGYAN